MLHGADRVRQGKTPTDLEQLLLNALGTVVSDPEARLWGQTYRQLVEAQGRLTTIPEVVTSRSVDRGYAMADLRQDMRHVVAGAMACPNVQIVDPFAVAAGQPEDPAFIAAMRDTGFAVTAYSVPPQPAPAAATVDEDGGGQAQAAPGEAGGEQELSAPVAFRVKLELESFYVQRAVGDAGGGKDEIYWTAATSTGKDGTGAGTYFSQKFGSVEKDETYRFDAGKKVLFEGSSKGFLGTSIQVWEAHQSDDRWWNELKKALNTAVDLIDDAMTIVDGFMGMVPMWASIAFEISKMFLYIIDVFRNCDDLSCDRTIGLNQQDLAVLSHLGNTDWHFNGDGHHILKVKYTGDGVPFPQGTVECAVRTDGAWGVPVPLGWKSITPPAIASYNGTLAWRNRAGGSPSRSAATRATSLPPWQPLTASCTTPSPAPTKHCGDAPSTAVPGARQ
ncbi:hypothetical protein BX286_0229 [Streptomyces sp. 3211.6]|nr:hypothetical protein BX286_0229 [Streptomyces sp. 3211.6]